MFIHPECFIRKSSRLSLTAFCVIVTTCTSLMISTKLAYVDFIKHFFDNFHSIITVIPCYMMDMWSFDLDLHKIDD